MSILDNTRNITQDVVIIGAGVVGLSIAFHLAERGNARVAVFERTAVGAGASGVQPGGVRQQWGTRLNCLMARESFRFYRDVVDRLEARTRPQLESCGYLFLAHSATRFEQLERDVALQNELGIGTRLLMPSEIDAVVPGINSADIVGAAYSSEDAYFDKPQAVVEAFASAATRLGVVIEHRGVDSIETAPNGTWLLRTTDGIAAADVVVVAAGCDTPALLAPLGIAAPIKKEPRYLFFSDPINERILEPLVVSGEQHFAAKQLANGRVLASDLAATPTANKEADWLHHVKNVSRSLMPVLEFVSYPILVEGFYDVTPDHQAILGPVDGLNGLWLAAGFSGHGFMMAPAVGRCMAAGILDGERDPFLESLALRRFEADELIPEMQVV